MNRKLLLIGLVALVGCREEDAAVDIDGEGFVQVESDPQGALISVNGVARNRFTPDTVDGLAGRRTITATLDSAGTTYGFQLTADFRPDSVYTILGPLITARCTSAATCQPRDHTSGRFGFRRSPMGPLFYQSGQGGGLRWPLGTANSYASIGSPIVAALMQGADTISLGIYDTDFTVGRPATNIQDTPFKLDQTFWVVPLPQLIAAPVVRGLEVREEVMATADPEVLLLRLTYTNITNRASYRALDILMPTPGVTLQQTWLGFAMDADVGEANDDLFAYAPADNAVFAYDAAFREDEFQGGETARPGLVGMRVVAAPGGATVVMSGWPRELGGGASGDWSAGTLNETIGFRIMSGTLAYAPDHPDPRIGHLPGNSANDYRIALSAGPVTLAPGESAQIQIAIAVAAPVAGTFTSGTVIAAGEPNDPNRPIMQTAAGLLAKLRAATAAN